MPFKKGYRHSEETKKKISKAKKLNPTRYWSGKKHSEKTKKKISAVQKKRYANGAVSWIKGKKPSEKTLKKLAKTWFKKGQSAPNKGKKHSEKAKKKMSEAQKKRYANGDVVWNKGKTGIYSEEHLKKMSESRKKLYASGFIHPMTGKKQNEKTKKALRLAHLGRKASAATKAKQSESWKKLNASGYQSPNKGKKHTKEAIEKIRVASLGRKPSAATIEKLRLANIGKKRSKETRQRQSESKKKFFSSKENRAKQSETLKKLYASGYVHPMAGKTWSEETRKKLMKIYATPEYRASLRERRSKIKIPKKDTKPEKILQAFCNSKGIKFQKHKWFNFGFRRAEVDVFIEPNICIMADGDFVHANPNLLKHDGTLRFPPDRVLHKAYKRRPEETVMDRWIIDDVVTKELEKRRCVVLRFWGYDIINNQEKCFQKIIKAIKKSSS